MFILCKKIRVSLRNYGWSITNSLDNETYTFESMKGMQISQMIQNLILIILYMGIHVEEIFSVELSGVKEVCGGLKVLRVELSGGELRDSGSVGEWMIPEFIEDLDTICKNERLITKAKFKSKKKNRIKLSKIKLWQPGKFLIKKASTFTCSSKCDETLVSLRIFSKLGEPGDNRVAKQANDPTNSIIQETMLEKGADLGRFGIGVPF